MMITGPIEEARVHVNRALELEPYFWVVQNLSAWIYYFEEKYREAIIDCIAARDLNPNYIENNWLFFLNYAKLGEGDKATESLIEISGRYPDAADFSAEIRGAYIQSGIKGLFQWLIDLNINNPVPVEGMNGHPYYLAWWNAIAGNGDEAVYWLEKNLEHPHPLWHYFNLIANNPDFDFIRNEQRFNQVIEKAGLAPYHKRKEKFL
jgi:tetratricopeptide (TPR) repeat protein